MAGGRSSEVVGKADELETELFFHNKITNAMSRKKNELKQVAKDVSDFNDRLVQNYDKYGDGDAMNKDSIERIMLSLSASMDFVKLELKNETRYLCEKHKNKMIDIINAFNSICYAQGAMTISAIELDKHEKMISMSSQPEQKSDI